MTRFEALELWTTLFEAPNACSERPVSAPRSPTRANPHANPHLSPAVMTTKSGKRFFFDTAEPRKTMNAASKPKFGVRRQPTKKPAKSSVYMPPVDDEVEAELDELDGGSVEDIIRKEMESGAFDSETNTYDPKFDSEESEGEEEEEKGEERRGSRGGGEVRGGGEEGFDLSGV